MFYHGVFILSVLMERIASMTKQCPMVLYPIHPTQENITCSLIPMAAGMTLHTTTPSLSQYACCNAYNIISLHHLPSIYKNPCMIFSIIISKCKLGCHHNVCVLYYIFHSHTSYLISIIMTIYNTIVYP